MTNLSRRYYERELGAGLGPSPSMQEHFGYSEPLRRFIQRESFEPQANEIRNNMPSWLPGDDYMTNFKVGDPYVRVDDGYARLPGAGYEALHPELEGVNPEDYPDIHKLRILSDVAPYSREYNQVSSSCQPTKTSRARAAGTGRLPRALQLCGCFTCVPGPSQLCEPCFRPARPTRTSRTRLRRKLSVTAKRSAPHRRSRNGTMQNFFSRTPFQAPHRGWTFCIGLARGRHSPYLVLILME